MRQESYRLYFEKITLKERVDGLDPGEYMQVRLGDDKNIIEISEYEKKTKDAVGSVKHGVEISEVGIGDKPSTPSQEETSYPDYQSVLDYLVSIIPGSVDDTATRLYIRSNDWFILQLPWEEKFKSVEDLVIIREMILGERPVFAKKNSLAVISSYAHKFPGGTDKENITRTLDKESVNIVNSTIAKICIERTEIKTRINSLGLFRYASKEVIDGINFSDYDMVHFLMHGLPNGDLCLSSDDKEGYKIIDNLSGEDYISLMSGHTFRLVAHAFCYSGGGLTHQRQCVSVGLLEKKGVEYVLGFYGEVNSTASLIFFKHFYDKLSMEENVEEAYVATLALYLKDPSVVEDWNFMPFFYKAV